MPFIGNWLTKTTHNALRETRPISYLKDKKIPRIAWWGLNKVVNLDDTIK